MPPSSAHSLPERVSISFSDQTMRTISKSHSGLVHKRTLRNPLWYVASAMIPSANIQTMASSLTAKVLDMQLYGANS